jgi:hypothetical protein
MLLNHIKWNILWNSGVAIINAVILVLLAKHLKLESFGIYSLLFSVITFAQVLDGALSYSILRSRSRYELVNGIKSGRGMLIVAYSLIILLSIIVLSVSDQINIVNVSLAIGMSCYYYKIADLNILSSLQKYRGNFKGLYRFSAKYTALTSLIISIVILLKKSQYESDEDIIIFIAIIYFSSMLSSLNLSYLTPVISVSGLIYTLKYSKNLVYINLINAINSNGKNTILGLNAGNPQLALFVVATQIPAKLMQLLQMTTEPLVRYFLGYKTNTSNIIKSSILSIFLVGVGLLIININSYVLFSNILKLSGDNLSIATDVLYFFSISIFAQSITLGISVYFIAHSLDKYNIESSFANAMFSYIYIAFCYLMSGSMSAIDVSIAACIGSGSSSFVLIYRVIYENHDTDSYS